MIKKRTEMIEKEIMTWSCDFCDQSTEINSGCCGTRQIMSCAICKKDCCREHRESFYEMDQDYPDITVCANCQPKFTIAWDKTDEWAKRYDNYADVAVKIFNNPEDYPTWDEENTNED